MWSIKCGKCGTLSPFEVLFRFLILYRRNQNVAKSKCQWRYQATIIHTTKIWMWMAERVFWIHTSVLMRLRHYKTSKMWKIVSKLFRFFHSICQKISNSFTMQMVVQCTFFFGRIWCIHLYRNVRLGFVIFNEFSCRRPKFCIFYVPNWIWFWLESHENTFNMKIFHRFYYDLFPFSLQFLLIVRSCNLYVSRVI